MKAKIKATGDIVTVVNYSANGGYIDFDVEGANDLCSLPLDKVELIPDTPTINGIDWEHRRFELVKSLAAGRMLRVNFLNYNKKSFVSTIVELADDIIAEYRKKGDKN